jgi:hypothetical protein
MTLISYITLMVRAVKWDLGEKLSGRYFLLRFFFLGVQTFIAIGILGYIINVSFYLNTVIIIVFLVDTMMTTFLAFYKLNKEQGYTFFLQLDQC